MSIDEVTKIQISNLSEDQALERILAFSRHFGSQHLDLAAHAAFPLVLTPDLLYRLWASFLPQLPWTTVADILLSPLCREVGYELYEIDPAIRNLLLRKLRRNPRFGEERFGELAGFLDEYILLSLNGDDPYERNLAEAQHLTALAQTAPDQAAREIAAKLSDPAQIEGSELLRVATLTESLAAQLQEYSSLVRYARGVERLAHGDQQTATSLLNRVFEEKEDIEIAGVTLQRPKPVADIRQAQVEEQTAPPVTQEASAPGVAKTFISYRRADSKYVADRLRERMIAAFGDDSIFRDIESIPVGVDFRTVVEREIGNSRVMLVLIGPQWANITDAQGNKRLFDPNDFTRIEVESALRNEDTRVIPVLVGDARMPGPEDLPESLLELSNKNAFRLRNDPDFELDLQSLIREMRYLVEEPSVSVEYFEPEMIYIPAGTFLMGSHPRTGVPAHETPQHEVFLPAFRIGKYPITNAQFETFIRETGRLTTLDLGWPGQQVPAGMENHPVVGVTWYAALDYCRWLSEKTGRQYTLPNEAQWEKACRGGNKTTYPWGDAFDPLRCNAGRREIAPVDSYPAQNDYGGFDFVGNVRQWTCTLWGANPTTPDPVYHYPWSDDRRNDLGQSEKIGRVVRGSSFLEGPEQARCSARSGHMPSVAGRRDEGCGFRIVLAEQAPPDVNVEQQVFISYAWGGEYERVVNELDADLQSNGITVIRDTRDLGFKGSIRDFVQGSGHESAVIVVISDKYLKSLNCMVEWLEIAANQANYDRIFPVVLADADIFDPVKRINYIKYWEEKRNELDVAMRSVDPANLQGMREETDVYDQIRDSLSNLTSVLKDMNTLTPEMHKDRDFADLISALRKRLAGGSAEAIGSQAQTTAARPPQSKQTNFEQVQEATTKQDVSSSERAPGNVKAELKQKEELRVRLVQEFLVDVIEGYLDTWSLAELERLHRTISLVANLMGGNKAFIRNLSSVSVQKADIGGHGGEASMHRISFPTRGTSSAWTIVHEIAHAWDANYGWRLSRLLEEYTGGSTNRLRSVSARLLGNWDAGLNGPENKPGRHGRLPGCNAAGYFYGDKPSGSNWYFNRVEDFAESVGMYIGWERGNELSDRAKAKIDLYLRENGETDSYFGVDNWADYRKYFYPKDGDYSKTKRWQFIDDLFKGKISLSASA